MQTRVPMDDDGFAHMLRMSTVYVSMLSTRNFFDGLDEMDDADRHNTLNCLNIVAETFVEMQRRLNLSSESTPT